MTYLEESTAAIRSKCSRGRIFFPSLYSKRCIYSPRIYNWDMHRASPPSDRACVRRCRALKVGVSEYGPRQRILRPPCLDIDWENISQLYTSAVVVEGKLIGAPNYPALSVQWAVSFEIGHHSKHFCTSSVNSRVQNDRLLYILSYASNWPGVTKPNRCPWGNTQFRPEV
jgi:hypothetical protein